MTPEERTSQATRIFEHVSPPLLDALEEAYGEPLGAGYLTAALSWLWGPRLNPGNDLSMATPSEIRQMVEVAKAVGKALPHEDTTFHTFRKTFDDVIEANGPTDLC